ncbi:DUF169 domain-containing protein [Candidatus Poribacteria bacterium]|nr:DUF169 domain-containing protein [Candidatus Poribacteria bacterium]
MLEVVRSYLGMKYHLVGVKISTESIYKTKLASRMRFCEMVKEAALGKAFYAEANDISCPNAELCLGFREPKYVEVEPRIKSKTQSIMVGPVDNADVVLLILSADQIMTISILLGGINANFKGEMGVCGEATAQVFETGKPNITFLCNGARMFGGFKSSEIILGLPYKIIENLAQRIEKLIKTGGSLCGCTVSDIPAEIVKNFEKIGFDKGSDFFFGKIDSNAVRIYLNKDIDGRIKYLTFYMPVKDLPSDFQIKKPFQMKERGNWKDIFIIVVPDEIGINLYTGKNLLEILTDLTKKALGK